MLSLLIAARDANVSLRRCCCRRASARFRARCMDKRCSWCATTSCSCQRCNVRSPKAMVTILCVFAVH